MRTAFVFTTLSSVSLPNLLGRCRKDEEYFLLRNERWPSSKAPD